jgi:DNA-binding MarR family transcriptional regulator
MSSPPDFGILLGLAYQAFVHALHENLAEHGFSDLGTSYGFVFRTLAAGPLHLTELASGLGITDPGMLKIVQEMEERRYVERKPDPTDGRAKFVCLAPRGRAALSAARRFHSKYERNLGAREGAEEAATTRRVLENLVGTEGLAAAAPRFRAF